MFFFFFSILRIHAEYLEPGVGNSELDIAVSFHRVYLCQVIWFFD